MKEIVAATLVFLAGAWCQSLSSVTSGTNTNISVQQDQMVAPKVTHNKVKHEIVDEVTTRECPAGYEGHFVDQYAGFESHFNMGAATWDQGGIYINGGDEGGPAYALCFKKDYMDQVRKNPDVSTYRPAPPRAVQYVVPTMPSWTPSLMPSTTWGTCTLPTTGITCSPGITSPGTTTLIPWNYSTIAQ